MEHRVSSLRFDSTAASVCRSLASISSRFTVVLIALSCALPALAAHQVKSADEEESVLVATWETSTVTQASDNAADPNQLQPTAQSSDHTPEIAANGQTEQSNAQFGEALEKVAESQQPKTWKQP